MKGIVSGTKIDQVVRIQLVITRFSELGICSFHTQTNNFSTFPSNVNLVFSIERENNNLLKYSVF